MGLFEVLADIAFEAIVDSNDKFKKAYDKMEYSDAISKRRVLMDAQVKAHSSGNTDAEEKIKEKRAEIQSTIDQYERQNKR
ncbi:MAG: hypothetical protein IJ944_03940 [Clostridia bacterium]|nr:hypothetical protein [Clostridia bacterium]